MIERKLEEDQSDVTPTIECGDKYRFGCCESTGEFPVVDWVGDVSNEIMTERPPVEETLSGMMLGLYVFGECQPCIVPADLELAEFSEVQNAEASVDSTQDTTQDTIQA